jgi:hypothetical protein
MLSSRARTSGGEVVRSTTCRIDQQLRDGTDDWQAQRPADECPAEMDGLQRARQGGHTFILMIVGRGLEGQAIEIAPRVVRGGHDLRAARLLALEPPA